MSLYEDKILPRCIDLVCGARRFDHERAALCAGLSGRVLELGFGSGTNLPFYPDAVSELVAVEPSASARAIAHKRRAAFHGALRFAELEAGQIAVADHSVDAVVCSFTLCTVPDARASLREVARVLRPGGAFHVLEHGLAPSRGVARVQAALDPLWSRLAGGCHLTRDVLSALAATGFVVHEAHQSYAPGTPRPLGFLTRATAHLSRSPA